MKRLARWSRAGRAGHGIYAKPLSEAVNRGDGRGRHPPQERPRPSRGTDRAAVRTQYSAAPAFSVTPWVSDARDKVVAPWADVDERRFQVVTCLSRRGAQDA